MAKCGSVEMAAVLRRKSSRGHWVSMVVADGVNSRFSTQSTCNDMSPSRGRARAFHVGNLSVIRILDRAFAASDGAAAGCYPRAVPCRATTRRSMNRSLISRSKTRSMRNPLCESRRRCQAEHSILPLTGGCTTTACSSCGATDLVVSSLGFHFVGRRQKFVCCEEFPDSRLFFDGDYLLI